VVEISPLTRLPGNLSITRQIQRRLDNNEIFALAYADLDNFKPFNDRYGFGRGDELIKMTGRIILNVVKDTQSQGCFIGHIGGDDFVVIMKPDLIEKAAENIIERFDALIAGFYDTADWDAGYIFAADRKGVCLIFDLPGGANRADQRMPAGNGAASDGHEKHGPERLNRGPCLHDISCRVLGLNNRHPGGEHFCLECDRLNHRRVTKDCTDTADDGAQRGVDLRWAEQQSVERGHRAARRRCGAARHSGGVHA